MPDDYLRSIESLIAIVLGCMRWKSGQAHEVGGENGRSTNRDDNTKRRLQCPIAPIILDLAEPRDAQFVMARVVSSGTTHGAPFVPSSVSIASERAGQVTAVGYPGATSP